jgi:ubiquitin-conjugating enzyme E2 J2
MEKQAIQRLKRELTLLQQTSQPNFIARPCESDMLTWHYVVFDLPADTAYSGGQYHGKLVFPREYPLKPPAIYMITPSGRFEVNKRLCLSMSDYHPETWNPSWRVETILLGLISFMLDETDPATAGGIVSSKEQRENDAFLSFFRNSRNRDFKLLFPDMLDPAKFTLESGFHVSSSVDHGSTSLLEAGISLPEIESVFTTDDLESLLDTRSATYTYRSRVSQKTFFLQMIPAVAVGALILFWACRAEKS